MLAAPLARGGMIQPAMLTNDLNNPHKGFLLWGTDYALGAPDNFHGATMFHVYLPWREVETADQQFAWADFEARHLAPITSDYPAATFVLRPVADYPDGPASHISTYYTGGEEDRDYPKFLETLGIAFTNYLSCDGDGPGRTPDWNDPRMITQVVEFVEAFGAQYDGDPRITAVQTGLLGLWGEWHQSGCEELGPSNAVKTAVREAYRRAFTNTPVQTRYPRDPDATGATFGFHEDYFPSFTAECLYGFPFCSDDGDWNLYYCFQTVNPSASNNWRFNPVSGESPAPPQQYAWTNDTEDLLTVIRNYHFSFLGPAGAHEKNAAPAVMARIKRTLGYNLHIVSFAWPDAVYVNEPFDVGIVWSNSGSAPPYHRFPVELAVCDGEGAPLGRYAWEMDLRQVLPGVSWSCAGRLVITSELDGVYSFRLGILHPRKIGEPGVLVQSGGRDAHDRYVLGDVRIYPRDSDTDGLPDSWEREHWDSLTNAPAGDYDEDGFSNMQELIAGTHPTNGASYLRVALALEEGNVLSLRWAPVTGRFYTIQSSTSLRGGFESGPIPGIPGTSGAWTDPAPPTGGQKLYRLSAEP